MLTKAQKVKKVEAGVEDIKRAKTLVFADFSGTKFEELRNLRVDLKAIGAKFQVLKKRLLRIIFEKSGIEFNPEQFESQVGTVFTDKDISEVAGIVYKFAKTTVGENKKERFQILGGFDILAKKFMDAKEVKTIGELPSKEILLGQLLGTIIGPARAFLYVLDQKSKQTINN
ncbi:MAG: 50S ribosomal protein L10 [Candidatus Liptonbacteria bacterium]|nr:50S ribosomal protein L10 [Candidatus Liptonbacteria bacterium]